MTDSEPFGVEYAKYYDLFYARKDYGAECDFLETLLARFATVPVQSILDLGCGTGSHALALAQRGYEVWGVDRSPAMLAVALEKAAAQPTEVGSVGFVQGDVRGCDLGRQFDAVVMLFAVLGYQTSNADLAATLANARRHLRPGGLVVADFWYGPAVLRQRPSDRIHEYCVNEMHVLRLAKARLNLAEHRVDVRYRILGLLGQEVAVTSEEEHNMRFFFPLELNYFAAVAGLATLRLVPFLDVDAPLSEDVWNVAGVWQAR